MISKCFFCEKITYTPFHVTELTDGTAHSYDMCKSCGMDYFKEEQPGPKKAKPMKKLDLTHIKTPEELLEFLSGMTKPEVPPRKPCECGMTIEEFDEYGKFGCAKCYSHFEDKMEELVYPYHGAREHFGKRPKNITENDPVEKLKLLKLQYAKALELEEYEKCPDLKKQIDELNQQLSSTSEDQ